MGIFGRIFGRAKPAQANKPAPRARVIGSTRAEEEAREDEAYDILRNIDVEEQKGIEEQQWYPLVSTNVDRIRYAIGSKKLQVIFKDGSLYEYDDVEPEIFQGFLQTHSPGQYVWYVLRGVYGYRKLSTGNSVSPPSPDRFSGRPFAVPAKIEALQKARRHGADARAPKAKPFSPPPPTFKG